MSKLRLATVWLDGCSGCHMSFLDMDEALITLSEKADLVYSPLVDAKIYPDSVDVALVEGAVSSEEDLHKILLIRKHTKTLVSLGDCAVTANVPSMRNPFGVKAVCDRAYRENATLDAGVPTRSCRNYWIGCVRFTRWFRLMYLFRAARLQRTPFTLYCRNCLRVANPISVQRHGLERSSWSNRLPKRL